MGSTAMIVFSKDRPLQLDATLRSLRSLGLDEGQPRPVVLYAASSPGFESSYGILGLQHPDVRFHRETDFKVDLISIVGDAEYVLFLVDDTLVTAQVPVSLAARSLDRHQELIGFSFRLGRNTTHCYPLNRAQALPEFSELDGGVLSFDWHNGEGDFGYPLELSSSMYRTADVRPLLGWLPYRNPNALEDEFAHNLRVFEVTRPRLACLSQSVAVSVPANVVQSEWSNRSGSDAGLDAQTLLKRFERGERLDVEPYEGVVSGACHQELGFMFSLDSSIPCISVIIPCRERGRHLQAAVEGLASLPFQDWEVVVVDDGAAGGAHAAAADVIAGFPGRRIRYLPPSDIDMNGGLGGGVLTSLGRYVLLLDEGRSIMPTMLSQMLESLDQDPSLGFVHAPDHPSLFRRQLWYREGLSEVFAQASLAGASGDEDLVLSCIEHRVNGLGLP